jgi:hypothetical protein
MRHKMPTLEVLTKARALIADPAHWTAGAYARDDKGNKVGVDAEGACAFCAVGALVRVTTWYGDYTEAYDLLSRNSGKVPRVADLNDIHGHEAVLAMYDAAISAAKDPHP